MNDNRQQIYSETVEETDGLPSHVREEITSLREKVDRIMKVLNASEDCDLQVLMKEFERLPTNVDDPARLGILSVCCREDRQWSNYGILTTTMDAVFNNPDASPEKVAEFIRRLANPKLIDVCRQAFLGKQRRSELLAECGLSDKELDAAVDPLLEWGFAIWEKIDDEPRLSWRRVGFHPIITLIFMAIDSLASKEKLPSSWSSTTGSTSGGRR